VYAQRRTTTALSSRLEEGEPFVFLLDHLVTLANPLLELRPVDDLDAAAGIADQR